MDNETLNRANDLRNQIENLEKEKDGVTSIYLGNGRLVGLAREGSHRVTLDSLTKEEKEQIAKYVKTILESKLKKKRLELMAL